MYFILIQRGSIFRICYLIFQHKIEQIGICIKTQNNDERGYQNEFSI